MRSHLFVIKVFIVVGSVWLYVIHPAHVPTIQKMGPAPLIERAASFTFPQKIETNAEADAVARISGDHRELSLKEISREISSVGAAVKAKEFSQDDSSASKKNPK